MQSPTDLRTIPDEQLLAQCRWEAFRGPGPGGQKRNKTSSAVRITHLPTGLSAIATESRSQHQNHTRALARLRRRLVLELRCPLDLPTFVPPPWLTDQIAPRGLLATTPRAEHYLPLMGLILDLLAATNWSLSAAAKPLGLTTATLVKFLERDRHLWAKVNQMRQSTGLKTLTPTRP